MVATAIGRHRLTVEQRNAVDLLVTEDNPAGFGAIFEDLPMNRFFCALAIVVGLSGVAWARQPYGGQPAAAPAPAGKC